MDQLVAEAVLTPETSPFLGSGLVADALPSAVTHEQQYGLVSPFAEALAGDEPERQSLFANLLRSLEDELFDDAVEALVDEAARLNVASAGVGEFESGAADVHMWAEQVTEEARQFLERIEEAFSERTPESITETEIDLAAARAATETVSPATEQLFGGLVNKIKSSLGAVRQAVTRVATTGLGVIGKLTGIGQITGILRRLIEPLVRRVVGTALHRLPPSVLGPARALAARLGIPLPPVSGALSLGQPAPAPVETPAMAPPSAPTASPDPSAATGEPASNGPAGSAEPIGEAFDTRLARALTAPNDASLEQLFAEAESEGLAPADDSVSALAVARARFADELADSAPGEAPVAPVEQFIPAVMAAMPLVRTAVRLLGRGRIRSLIAGPLATFIAPFVGQQAARSLAPHIADTGMRLLRLEHEDPGQLGTEALVSTVEETVRQVLSLPETSLGSDLRLTTEVQEAFTEAAARYLPSQVLRSDLVAAEADDEGGWVLMPRHTAPHYRYRAYTHPLRVLVSQPVARAIVYSDGQTMEERLLDAGVSAWPVEAEVQLFEALPGTRLGHVAAGQATDTLGEVPLDEYERLTPSVAGLLLGRPSLFRAAVPAAGPWLAPGGRYFRVMPVGRVQLPARRPVRRFGVRLDVSGAAPVIRVHLRIGERVAHEIARQLEERQQAQVVAAMRGLLGERAKEVLTTRLGRLRGLNSPTSMTDERRRALAASLAESMLTTVANELPASGAAIATAAKDPARGITMTFAFPFDDRSALHAGTPGAPTLTIRPGYRHD